MLRKHFVSEIIGLQKLGHLVYMRSDLPLNGWEEFCYTEFNGFLSEPTKLAKRF